MSIRIRVYPQASSSVVQARRRATRARARARRQHALYARRHRIQRYLIQQQLLQQTLGYARPGWSRFASPAAVCGYAGAVTGALPYQQAAFPYGGYGVTQVAAPWAAPRPTNIWSTLGGWFGI